MDTTGGGGPQAEGEVKKKRVPKRRGARLGRMRRSVQVKAATEVADKLSEILTPIKLPAYHNISEIEKSGLMPRVAELVYLGKSNRHIALILGYKVDNMNAFIRSDRFQSYMEMSREKLNERLDEAVSTRLKDALVGAIEDLLDMRGKSKGFLRRQLNMDIIELNQKYRGLGGGGPSEALLAVHRKTTRAIDGTVTTESYSVRGSREEVAAVHQARRGGPGDEPAGGGEGDGPHSGEGEDVGGECAPQDAEAAQVVRVLEGGHRDDFQPEREEGGDAEVITPEEPGSGI